MSSVPLRPVPAPPTREQLADYVGAVAAAAVAELAPVDSVIWKGSAYKPWEGPYDFLPGLSDLDVHVYRPGGLDEPWDLRRRILGQVGAPPAGIPLQLMVLDSLTLPEWWTVLPGTYGVLHGGPPPAPVPPTPLLLERDRMGLAEAGQHASQIAAGVLTRTDADLWPYLVEQRWMFMPCLYRAVSLSEGDPVTVWAHNRTGLLAAAARHESLAGLRRRAVAFLDAALTACRVRNGGSSGTALRLGRELLMGALGWYEVRPEAVPERRSPAWWRHA